MHDTLFPPWPFFTQEEADAVSRVLLSNKVNYWTGQECHEFEREFALWSGSTYAVALANGTLSLEAALKVLGIGQDDEVIVTPRSFIASASCIVAVGAAPIFADVDRNTQNITADTIDKVLTPKTKAIICVHLAGMPCDMDSIMDLAHEKGIFVIEDCAQAHGARYKGRSVGSIGHIGAWSFCQDKIMTTGGEGGMVTTNDRELWLKLWSYKDHGKSWSAVYEKEHLPGFRWLHESFGSNYRMHEIQAVIGRIQLRRMSEWSKTRREYAKAIYNEAKKLSWLRVPDIPDWANHAFYTCYVFLESSALPEGWDRERIIAEINTRGVPCYSGSCSEIYLEKAFDNTKYQPKERLLVAKELGETSIMFLVHPTLRVEDIKKTCEVIASLL